LGNLRIGRGGLKTLVKMGKIGNIEKPLCGDNKYQACYSENLPLTALNRLLLIYSLCSRIWRHKLCGQSQERKRLTLRPLN